MQCGHSTGSITGCRPLCSAPATHAVTELHGRVRMLRCAEHVQPTVNACWPTDVSVSELDGMRFAGRAYIRTGSQWSRGWHYNGSGGSGDVETLREYIARAESGELRNLQTVHSGDPDEYVTADVYVRDWSVAS